MGIQVEFNPDLALRSIVHYREGRRDREECVPENLAAGLDIARVNVLNKIIIIKLKNIFFIFDTLLCKKPILRIQNFQIYNNLIVIHLQMF